jgi:RimJ/RimL family protein N-acetyltransferase
MLTPLRDEDSPTLFAWINDRELLALSSRSAPPREEEHLEWFDAIRRRDDVEIYAIRLGERLIGTCQLHDIDRGAGTAQLQIRIGERDAWGRGYGTEAVRLLVRHAFEELGLNRVDLHVFATNEPAIRAYEKAGFVHEGEADGIVRMTIQS